MNNSPFNQIAKLATDASGNTVLVGANGNITLNAHSIGNRVLLLGDSMTLAHNQVLASASASFSRTNNVTTVTFSGHALISKQLITVTGFSSVYGFNANRVEITWLTANTFSYPNSGNDIGVTAGTVSTSTNCITILDRTDNRGWINHANGKLNGGLQIINNAGVGGDTFAMMRARLATDVDAFDFDILALHGGFNGINAGNTAATEWADCKAIIDKYISLGKTVILVTVLPIGPSGSGSTKYADASFQTQLSELRRLQLNYSRPGLMVVDGYLDAVDPADAYGCSLANMTGDGTHPTAKLARLIGTRVYNAINGKQPFADLRPTSKADVYSAGTRPLVNQLLNAGWAGTGGTGTNYSSAALTYTTVPSGIAAQASGAGITGGTVTGVARSDSPTPFGYDMNVASVTTAGSGNILCNVTVPAGSFTTGDELVFIAEVTIAGDSGVVTGVYGQIVQHSSLGNGYDYGNAASGTAAQYGVADGTYLIVTPPMKVIAEMTSVECSAVVSVNGTGTITNIKLGRVAVYKNLFNSRS